MSDARKRAEEALEEHDAAVAGDEWAFAPISLAVADALRAVLAEAPTAPPADAATEAVREAAEAIIAEGVGNLVSHVPRHECIGDAGVIMVRPACSCGWSRSALYPADGHLVFAAYHTHLVACRLGNEELTAALHASAKCLLSALSPAPAPSAPEVKP